MTTHCIAVGLLEEGEYAVEALAALIEKVEKEMKAWGEGVRVEMVKGYRNRLAESTAYAEGWRYLEGARQLAGTVRARIEEAEESLRGRMGASAARRERTRAEAWKREIDELRWWLYGVTVEIRTSEAEMGEAITATRWKMGKTKEEKHKAIDRIVNEHYRKLRAPPEEWDLAGYEAGSLEEAKRRIRDGLTRRRRLESRRKLEGIERAGK